MKALLVLSLLFLFSLNVMAANECANMGPVKTVNCQSGGQTYSMTYKKCTNSNGQFGGVVCLSDNNPGNDHLYMSVPQCCGATAAISKPLIHARKDQ
jgi:hypothetical protein